MLTARWDALLARGRAMAEALMVDDCAVLRKIGSAVDDDTGAEVDEFATVYTGPCRLRMNTVTGGSASRQVGEQTVTTTRIEWQAPWHVDYVEVDDRVVMLASQSPGLVQRAVQVTGPWLQTTSAACRYPCIESTIPETP